MVNSVTTVQLTCNNILLYVVVSYCAHYQNDVSAVCHVCLFLSLEGDFSFDRDIVTLMIYSKDLSSFLHSGLCSLFTQSTSFWS